MWIDPIFDRTAQDVAHAQANRASTLNLKGGLNYADWARITGNIHHLAELLASFGTNITVYCDTAWDDNAFPTHSRVMAIYQDIERLQAGFARYADVPLLSWNTYQKINLVERILYELKSTLDRMSQVYPRAGNMIHAGAYFYIKN